MKCETFVREHLPAIRALLAKELTARGLTQQEAADKLYLTQPAIAFYKGHVRGKKTKEISKIPGVSDKIEELARKIISFPVAKEALEKEYCSFCKLIMK
jgi:predicted transcriptional regulator